MALPLGVGSKTRASVRSVTVCVIMSDPKTAKYQPRNQFARATIAAQPTCDYLVDPKLTKDRALCAAALDTRKSVA
jgi:hypothetical protein